MPMNEDKVDSVRMMQEKQDQARRAFESEYESHVSTWAANCGAPKSVYLGHLARLLEAARRDERALLRANAELLAAAKLAVLNFERWEPDRLFDDDHEAWGALTHAIAKAEQ